MTVNDEIRAFAAAHPDMSHGDIARALGKQRGNVWSALVSHEPEDVTASRHAIAKRNERVRKSQVENLVGTRFGRLTVIAFDSVSSRGMSRWLCRCDCGREKAVQRAALMNGTVWRCGRNCPFDTGMVPGRTFGSLMLVRKLNESDTQEGEVWLCRCECGNECEVTTRKLRRHVVTSCGCHKSRNRRIRQANGAFNETRLSLLNDTPTARSVTGIRGVQYWTSDGLFHAGITFRRVHYDLGAFWDVDAAADARKRAEEEIWGPVLRSNGLEYPTESQCEEIVSRIVREARHGRRP